MLSNCFFLVTILSFLCFCVTEQHSFLVVFEGRVRSCGRQCISVGPGSCLPVFGTIPAVSFQLECFGNVSEVVSGRLC